MRVREFVLGLALLTAPTLAADRAEAEYADNASVYVFFSPSEMMAKHDISMYEVKRLYQNVEKRWRDRFDGAVRIKLCCTASKNEKYTDSDNTYCGFYFGQSAASKRTFLDIIDKDAPLPATFVNDGLEHKLVKSDEELCAALGYGTDCLN